MKIKGGKREKEKVAKKPNDEMGAFSQRNRVITGLLEK